MSSPAWPADARHWDALNAASREAARRARACDAAWRSALRDRTGGEAEHALEHEAAALWALADRARAAEVDYLGRSFPA